jgi:hypothetical protein
MHAAQYYARALPCGSNSNAPSNFSNAHWASMTIADETKCAQGCTNYRAAM